MSVLLKLKSAAATMLGTAFRTDLIDDMTNIEMALNTLIAAGAIADTISSSVTSRTIGTGSKTFTIQTGKSYVEGMWVNIASGAAPSTNYMVGIVTSYSGSTLIVDVISALGSGTYADWVISQSLAMTAAANLTVSASTGVALTVVNTGAGNSFLVEDAASPDATPFAIDQNGVVIAGHTSALTIDSIGTGVQNHISSGQSQFRWTNDADGTFSFHAKSRSTTKGSYSIITSGDALNYTPFYGDDGVGFIESSRVSVISEGTPAVGNIGSKITWTQRNTAGSLFTAMNLSRDGLLTVAGGAAITGGVLDLPSYTTGTRPTAATGNLIYDTTLNKMCIGTGAGTWEVVTSA